MKFNLAIALLPVVAHSFGGTCSPSPTDCQNQLDRTSELEAELSEGSANAPRHANVNSIPCELIVVINPAIRADADFEELHNKRMTDCGIDHCDYTLSDFPDLEIQEWEVEYLCESISPRSRWDPFESDITGDFGEKKECDNLLSCSQIRSKEGYEAARVESFDEVHGLGCEWFVDPFGARETRCQIEGFYD